MLKRLIIAVVVLFALALLASALTRPSRCEQAGGRMATDVLTGKLECTAEGVK